MSSKRFTGFKTYKPPVFTVTCPQTGYQYEVRSMNVGEISKIKQSLITANRISETVNDVLWDCIQKETLPEIVVDKESFESITPLNDRNTLVYGLYTITFGASKEWELTCRFCGNQSSHKLDYSKYISFLPYPKSQNIMDSYTVSRVNDEGKYNAEMEDIIEEDSINKILIEFKGKIPPKSQPEDIARVEGEYDEFFKFIEERKSDIKLPYFEIVTLMENLNKVKEVAEEKPIIKNILEQGGLSDILNKRVEVILPETKLLVIIKSPLMLDESRLNNRLIMNNEEELDIAGDVILIDRIEEYVDGEKSPVQIISDQIDILHAYYQLPVEDRKHLMEVYKEEFGKYGLEIKLNWDCTNPRCAQKNDLEVDIVRQFFRAINES